MAKLYFLLPLLFLLMPKAAVLGQSTELMSYNIKYDNKNDTVNNWNDRKQNMIALLEHYAPSIIGMQEVLFNQLEFIDHALPDYRYIGVGREDGKQKGEFSPIFYHVKKHKLLQANTFWLSETPEKISVGWDAALERICTYGLFEDIKTKKKLWVFNTHFDHRGDKAREESVRLILKKIKQINIDNLPVIVMGDLNLTPDLLPIKQMNGYFDDGRKITQSPFYGPVGTFNGFDNRPLDRRIDYIFTKNLSVIWYTHIDDRMDNNKHISDHLPVWAKVTY